MENAYKNVKFCGECHQQYLQVTWVHRCMLKIVVIQRKVNVLLYSYIFMLADANQRLRLNKVRKSLIGCQDARLSTHAGRH